MWAYPKDVLVRQEQCKDLLREAERERLIQQIRLSSADDDWRYRRFHCRLLTWLGNRLVALGTTLQRRYGSPSPAPSLQTANSAN
jgi:hypothetical protein